jgi:hypothetical protein
MSCVYYHGAQGSRSNGQYGTRLWRISTCTGRSRLLSCGATQLLFGVVIS